jgi:ATP-dependent helicase/DNAse subunit B
MLVTYIRSSSYNNYAFCEMQYFLTYVLGHPSTSGKKAQLGTIVHKAMECLSACKKRLQYGEHKQMSIEDDKLGKIDFTKRKLATKKFVNEMIDLSYDYYTSTCVHNYTNADHKFCKKMTWDALEYNGGQFDPRKRNIVASEPHFDIPIEEDWAKYSYELPSGETVEGQLAIKGTIDLVTEVDDGVIEVIDWKTGRRLDWATGEEKTYEKLSSDPQLLLYYYAISNMFPDYDQAIMSIFYIRDGGPFSMCFDKEDQDKFLGMLKKRFESIQHNQTPKLISKNRSNWKCTKLCHFYKNNWEGTNTCMCSYVEDHLKENGMSDTIRDCTKEGFAIGHYEAPG